MGFELLRAAEQFGAASAALVHAFGLGIGVLTDERALGSSATQHVELLRVEFLAPLVVAELQLWRETHAPLLLIASLCIVVARRKSCLHASANGGDPLRPAAPRLRSPRARLPRRHPERIDPVVQAVFGLGVDVA